MFLFGKNKKNKINIYDNQKKLLKWLPESEAQEVKHTSESCYKYLLEDDELHA